MPRLSAVLAHHVDDTPEFGPGRSSKTETLRDELKAVSRQANVVFALLVAMLVALFVGCVALVAMFLDQPGTIAAILTATGVSMPVILKTMMTLWKEKVASDMLTAMVTTLDPDVAKTVVHIAAGQLFGRPSAPHRGRRAAARR